MAKKSHGKAKAQCPSSTSQKTKFRSQILTYASPGPDSHDLAQWTESVNVQVRADLRDLVPQLAITAKTILAAVKHNGGLSRSKIPNADLATFAQDFYHCFTTGSGVLSNHLGAELVLRTFRVLAPYFGSFSEVDDAVLWDELPEQFVVYRGGTGPAEELACGYSWTRSLQIANSFAFGESPMVLTTRVSRRHLLACFVFQNECILDASSFPELVMEQTVSVFA